MTEEKPMPENRYFLPTIGGDRFDVVGPELHHMKHVMRKTKGDRVELVDGKGLLAVAEISEMGKRVASLAILEKKAHPKPSYQLVLRQALPRRGRLDSILEKATELGVTHIALFPGENSEVTAFGFERAEQVLVSAMKQCGRLFLPKLSRLDPISSWEKVDSPCYFGDMDKDAPLLGVAWKKASSAALVIGPEAGFSEGEVSALRELDIQGVRLHPLILRTDTGAISGLSIMSHFMYAEGVFDGV